MVANTGGDSAASCVLLSELAGEKAERLGKVAALLALYVIPEGKGAEPTPILYPSTRRPSP